VPQSNEFVFFFLHYLYFSKPYTIFILTLFLSMSCQARQHAALLKSRAEKSGRNGMTMTSTEET
jgi:hypothetical protein